VILKMYNMCIHKKICINVYYEHLLIVLIIFIICNYYCFAHYNYILFNLFKKPGQEQKTVIRTLES